MKPHDWNDAFPQAPARFEARIRYTVSEMEQLTMKRNHKLKMILVIAMMLIALLSVAVAASLQWGVLDFLTYRDDDGSIIGESHLAPLVNELDLTRRTDDFILTVRDSICDGTTFVAAWSFDNAKPDEPLFLYYSLHLDGERVTDLRLGTHPAGYYIAGGDSSNTGVVWALGRTMQAGGTGIATISYDVIRSKVELFVPETPATHTETAWEDYEVGYDEQALGGRLLAKHGQLITPQNLQSEEGTDLDRMLSAGLLERVDQFEIQIPITATSEVKSALDGGIPIEKPMDGYAIRVTRADLHPNATYIDLEYVFETEEDMLRVARSRAGWLRDDNGREVMLGLVGCYAGTLQETEARLEEMQNTGKYDPLLMLSGFGASTGDIFQREDGKWVAPMHQEMTPLLSTIRAVTILPMGYRVISNIETEEVFYWEDALTLTFNP